MDMVSAGAVAALLCCTDVGVFEIYRAPGRPPWRARVELARHRKVPRLSCDVSRDADEQVIFRQFTIDDRSSQMIVLRRPHCPLHVQRAAEPEPCPGPPGWHAAFSAASLTSKNSPHGTWVVISSSYQSSSRFFARFSTPRSSWCTGTPCRGGASLRAARRTSRRGTA